MLQKRCRGAFLLDLLERVEATPHTQALLLTDPDERPVGEVLSTAGQVCMITLAEGHEPLGARLRELDPRMADAIRDALAQAKLDGRPLMEALSALGEEAGELVRRVLCAQLVEGLTALARFEPGSLLESVLSSSRRQSAILGAFAAIDVYWRAVAALAPTEQDAARTCFEELGDEVERAALVARDAEPGGVPLLVGTRGFTPASVAEVAGLGRLVEGTLRPPAFVASGEVPGIISLGRSEDAVLGIASGVHMALFVGVRTETRARLIARVGQMTAGGA